MKESRRANRRPVSGRNAVDGQSESNGTNSEVKEAAQANTQADGASDAKERRVRKKSGIIILIAALVMIIGGLSVIAYPFILSTMSDSSLQREVESFEAEVLAAAPAPQAQAYIPIDTATMEVDTAAKGVREEIVNDTWYSEEGSAEEAEYLLELPALDTKFCAFPAEDIEQMYPNMRKGASLYPETATVGTIGNTAMAAHRTGPSDFFRELDLLQAGDEIFVHTRGNGSYKYEVEDVFIVEPTEWEVIDPTDYPALTLTSCQEHGGVSNAKRIIVRARLTEYAPLLSF